MGFARELLRILLATCLAVFAGCRGRLPAAEPNEMVLRHVLYTPIAGLDPACRRRDVYSRIVASQIFETLYDYHFLKRP